MRRRTGPKTIASLLLLGLLSCSSKYPPLVSAVSDSGPTCLTHARVLSGEALIPLSDHDLCFAGGAITTMQPHGAAPLPAGAREIDVGGATVLPGLVDTHVHATASEAPPWRVRLPDPGHNLQAWLYSGITTVYDMGGATADVHKLQGELASGRRIGPRLFHTHEPITAPGGHPIPAVRALLPWPLSAIMARQVPVLADAADAPALIRGKRAAGAEYVKIIYDALPPGAPQLDPVRLKALIDAAHAEGLKAFVHIGSSRDALEAVAAGADHLAHGVYRDDISDELVGQLKARGVTVTYTAAGFANTVKLAAGTFQPDAWARATSDPALVESVTGAAGAELGRLPVLGPFAKGILDEGRLQRNIRKLHDGGVVILIGTDSPIAAVFPGGSFHEELAFLHAAGIPADVLLRRATVEGARLLSASPDFGVIAVGKRADLLVVRGDPRQDLGALRDIVHLFQAGKRVERLSR